MFALALDLGNITNMSEPVVWSIGVVRNPVVAYTTGAGKSQVRVPYFLIEYNSISDAVSAPQSLTVESVLDWLSQIDAFVADFAAASQRATEFDKKMLSDASAISPQYANLVSLAARQTIGSTELTIANGTDGRWNTSDVKMFMKDVGTSRFVAMSYSHVSLV